MMLNKQLRRGEFMGKDITPKDMKDFISRAKDAPKEMKNMKNFTSVIVCREGEGSPCWNMKKDGSFYSKPEYDAARALKELVEIINYKDVEAITSDCADHEDASINRNQTAAPPKDESRSCSDCVEWDNTAGDCFRISCVHNKHKYPNESSYYDMWS